MIGITLTSEQIRNAPPDVRRWIEHEVIASLSLAADAPPAAGLPAQAAHLAGCSAEEAAAVASKIQGMMAAVNVFFEFSRPGISVGQPAAIAYRLIDILHHTRLANIEQVMTCLELINQTLAQLRGDPSARFCGFDSEGHCLIAPQTQASIAALWQSVLASQQPAPNSAAA
jgi:hypothetical protein